MIPPSRGELCRAGGAVRRGSSNGQGEPSARKNLSSTSSFLRRQEPRSAKRYENQFRAECAGARVPRAEVNYAWVLPHTDVGHGAERMDAREQPAYAGMTERKKLSVCSSLQW